MEKVDSGQTSSSRRITQEVQDPKEYAVGEREKKRNRTGGCKLKRWCETRQIFKQCSGLSAVGEREVKEQGSLVRLTIRGDGVVPKRR